MKGLKFSRTAVALYVKKDRFIAYFETPDDAKKFAKQHFPNIEAHIDPFTIYKFEAAE